MIGFENPKPAIRPYAPHLIEMLEPLVWHGEFKGQRYKAMLPAGAVLDGASVPRLGWTFLRSHWIDLLAFGGLHDLFFRSNAVIEVAGGIIPVPGWAWANREGCKALATLGPLQAADVWKVRPVLMIGSYPSWHQRDLAWRGDSV